MAQQSQWSRELRILGNIVFAVPRALRWIGAQFALGVRSGMASAKQTEQGREPGNDAG